MGSRLNIAAAALFMGALFAAPEGAGAAAPNGTGADRDGDSNPAVNTRLIARIGDAAEAALDPPFRIVTFEAPPGDHNDVIRDQYFGGFGVKFSNGLKRQICKGQRYFRYDTECTYMAAPSGKYAAVYRDDWRRPLRIGFDKPACAAALAIYPTGGDEDEPFEITLQPYAADETKLASVKYQFTWTHDTFRWRLMAGAFFVGQKATRLDVNIKSQKTEKKIVRFLIDDVAFIADDCVVALADIAAETAPASAGAAAQ